MDLQFRSKEDFLKVCVELFDEHCKSKSLPLFFPDQNKTETQYFQLPLSSFDEAECSSNEVVYNSLRNLKEPIMVMLGVHFSHYHFHMFEHNFDQSNLEECSKTKKFPNCAPEHRSTIVGKADFLVFGPSYVVIIDIIDNADVSTPKSYFEDFIREKVNNQRTMLRFIHQISKGNQTGETSEASTLFKVFRYIAFPRRNKSSKISLVQETRNSGERVGIMKKAEFHDLEEWWFSNVLESQLDQGEYMRGNFLLVQQTLFTLWWFNYDASRWQACPVDERDFIQEVDYVQGSSAARRNYLDFLAERSVMLSRRKSDKSKTLSFKNKEDFIDKADRLFELKCRDKNLPLFFPDNGNIHIEMFPLRSDMYSDCEEESNKIVYNALKSIQQPILVLHGLTFNHIQFQCGNPIASIQKYALKVELFLTVRLNIEKQSSVKVTS